MCSPKCSWKWVMLELGAWSWSVDATALVKRFSIYRPEYVRKKSLKQVDEIIDHRCLSKNIRVSLSAKTGGIPPPLPENWLVTPMPTLLTIVPLKCWFCNFHSVDLNWLTLSTSNLSFNFILFQDIIQLLLTFNYSRRSYWKWNSKWWIKWKIRNWKVIKQWYL